MVYQNKLVVAIKNKGKVLREFSGNVVRIPFNSDYSIFVKNKDLNRRVVVNIKVDGKDVLDGNSLVVEPNNSTELKGFIKGSTVRNSFRFIEKTDEIAGYRGNNVEDGLVEVEYRFERYDLNTFYVSPVVYALDTKSKLYDVTYCSCCNESGITVSGKEIYQPMTQTTIGDLESYMDSIIIHLKGYNSADKSKVVRPVTVKTKVRCTTCGRQWKSSMKYCGNCSTYLH